MSVVGGTMRVVQTMTLAAARRTALAAQGFVDPSPGSTASRRHLRRVLARTQLVQLDSVNVAVRAHYMPMFSRLGGYPVSVLDHAAWTYTSKRSRELVEYWAHEACLMPVDDWPLLRWRMRRYGDDWHGAHRHLFDAIPGLADDVLAVVKEHGPIGAGAVERELYGQSRRGPGVWWNRSDTKKMCELLFALGELTTGTRRGFERLYDLPERVLPAAVLAAEEPAEEDAVRQLVERSARALGVATEPDLRDYYRLTPAQSQRAVAELVEQGRLEPVAVRGWTPVSYRHVDARTPRKVNTRALLCPFDPLIWHRPRVQRLFDFRYRLEIYTPAAKRTYGYYVFPFLLGDRLVARVDLKADRAHSVLRVQGAFAEPGVDRDRVVDELNLELHAFADWLQLDEVAFGDRGDLVEPLRAISRPRR